MHQETVQRHRRVRYRHNPKNGRQYNDQKETKDKTPYRKPKIEPHELL